MTFIWIVLGLAAWMVGFLFLMVLMRMASAEDRAALQQERLFLEPLSNAIVTRAGDGQFACIDRRTELVVDAADVWVTWRQECAVCHTTDYRVAANA